jgi:DNA-binding NarL/FixJ family response regulator
VIVMDIAVPVIGGLDAAQAILAADPYARILVLSAYNDREYRELANTIGAAGFLEKQASASDFKRTIREIAAGRPLPPPGAAAPARSRAPTTLPRASPRLTPRETEVLHLVAEGFPNKRAAVELGISVRTVEKHRQHLSGKLDLHSTAELTRYAMAARDSRSLGD